MIEEQFAHAVLPESRHDDLARQGFVQTLKRELASKLTPGVRNVWEGRTHDLFLKEHGREPSDRHEIRHFIAHDSYYQYWCAVRRVSQECLYDSITEMVEGQLDTLVERARVNGGSAGTLELDPELDIPAYIRAVDIHCMPTGYWSEYREDDVAAGAIYDRAVHVYAQGQFGPLNDNLGRTVCENYLSAIHTDFSPARILDMGCTVGHSTLPYVESFPDAEVWGIDVAAPVLRYAHARAVALGKAVHFSQQNAERTRFRDGHFDLVVSHILMHETSGVALKKIFAESYRLLAPGGLMIHAEFPQYKEIDTFTQFMMDWDTYNNNEPFWGAMHDTDLEALAADVGFERAGIETVLLPTGRKLQLGRGASGTVGKLALTVARS